MSLSAGIGLISGLDFNDIIARLTAVNSRPVQLLQNKARILASRDSALQGINKALLKLKESLESLNDESDFLRKIVKLSNSDIASVSSTSTAANQSFQLQVLQLAQEHRIGSQGVADANETAIASGAGVFEFQVGADPIESFNVTATTTLNDLRDAINAKTEDTGVRASIVNDGSATNAYRLILSSSETGAANQITVGTNDTDLDFNINTVGAAVADPTNAYSGPIVTGGTYTGSGTANIVIEITRTGANPSFKVSFDGGLSFGSEEQFSVSGGVQNIGEGITVDFDGTFANAQVSDRFTFEATSSTLQFAQDARIEVDGVQITRETNTFDDVIEGATITAKKVDAALSTVTISNDNQNPLGLIQQFVSDYNSLIDTITKVASFDADSQVRGPLFGDSTVRSIRSALSRITSSAIAGLSGGTSLGSIGVKLGEGGKLSVDSAKLGEALDDNFNAVKEIFALIGNSTSSGFEFDRLTNATKAGTYGVDITTVAQQAFYVGDQAISGAGIAQDETLTFTVDGKDYAVTLTQNSTIAQIVSRLNDFFTDEGVDLTAEDKDGKLRVETDLYGSSIQFSVVSTEGGGGDTDTGFGTTLQSLKGVDVEGFIGARIASGQGQFLSGAIGSDAEGLRLLVTALSTTSGSITVSRGIADRLIFNIDNITDSSDGLIKTKSESLQTSIETIGERIETMNKRLARQADTLRKQFTGLELQLSKLQTQGSFLLSQLAGLNASLGR